MASGDVVLKDGTVRDKFARKSDVMAFEMEGAGVSFTFPTVIIKAGCDYADSHKKKHWQEWAAMTAASCAKAFLGQLQMGIATNVEYVSEGIGKALEPISHIPLNPESTYEQAVRRRVKYFRGRREQLTQIQEYFETDVTDHTMDESRVLILQAMGGQGKSQIALEYCRQSRSRYAEIFWVNASSETMAVQSLERVAAEIGQPLMGIDDARTRTRLVVHTLARRNERWLMVLDNYDDPDHFATIDRFIPSYGLGDILITTRSRGLESLGQVLTVPPMTQQEGTELLLRDHPTSEVDTHQEKCYQIVRRLGGLPLALDQAAAFIRYKQLASNQLDEFLSLYDAQREEVLRHTPRRFWKYGTVQIDGKEEENRAISAFTTWEMSFRQWEEDEGRGGDIEHFLTVSAFLQPDQINESVFRHYCESTQEAPAWMRIFSQEGLGRNEYHRSSNKPDGVSNSDLEGHPTALSESGSDTAGCETPILSQTPWNAELFWELISKAYDLSLFDSISSGTSVGGARFSLHPVICDWLQFRIGQESCHELVWEAIEMVADSVRQIDRSVQHSLQARMILLGHVDRCVENDRRFSPDGRRLGQELRSCAAAEWFASFYQNQGRYGMAEGLYRQGYDTRRKTVGIEDASTLTSMNNLALALSRQGKYKEAEEIHRQTLQLSKKVLGEEHPLTLTSMNNLSLALSRQGKYKEAEEIHRQTLQLSKKVLGEEYHLTLTNMNNLAFTLSRQGQYEEAEGMHRETLQLRRKVMGEEHPDTLTSINNLAGALSGQEKYKEAEEMHRETLQLSKKVLGEEHPSTLTSMNNLAYLLALQSRSVQSAIFYERTIAGYRRVLGPDHPTTRACVEQYSLFRNSRVNEN